MTYYMALLDRGEYKADRGVYKTNALQIMGGVLKILGSSYYLQTHLEPILYIPLYRHIVDTLQIYSRPPLTVISYYILYGFFKFLEVLT